VAESVTSPGKIPDIRFQAFTNKFRQGTNLVHPERIVCKVSAEFTICQLVLAEKNQ
jgi:hypothetical protein